jgi:hypothetical protein
MASEFQIVGEDGTLYGPYPASCAHENHISCYLKIKNKKLVSNLNTVTGQSKSSIINDAVAEYFQNHPEKRFTIK